MDDDPAFLAVDDPATQTLWRFEREFLTSRWTCIWDRGCEGILEHPAAALRQGCCSVGAEFGDPDEARTVSALAATIDPATFQHHGAVDAHDVFSDSTRTNTKIVDGACIFLNRPGFAGGEGCALHLAAIAAGEPPADWKPSVCSQMPIKVDWHTVAGGGEVATVRAWRRPDWGDDGAAMAWWCTEHHGSGADAYVGDRPVFESLAAELSAVAGQGVYVELRRRLRGDS